MFSRNYSSRVENVGVSDRDGDFDIVYYNADMITGSDTGRQLNKLLGFTGRSPIEFKETRTKPILNNAKNFDFSIVRFQVE